LRVRNAETELEEIEEQLTESPKEEIEILRERKLDLEERLNHLRAAWNAETNKAMVTEEDIAEVISMWTGIPLTRIAGEESERLLQMEEALRARIVGQNEAIETISKAVRRARAGLKDPRRPIGSFIFLGPTGVGKTELTKTLAEFLFGSEDALIQLDMSEFMERHTVARLVGAPPGYVGYEDAGQLTEALRRRPYSIVVFDEIEKAHPEAFNMLLQIMEEGHLSDARGRTVDFRNAIIVMTSNVGAETIKRGTILGFGLPQDADETGEYEEMRKKVMDELRRLFRPEFLNRVDGTIVFRALNKQDIRDIVEIELDKVRARLIEHGLTLEATDAGRNWLAENGYNPEFGARPLRRLIQHEVEDKLSDDILSGKFPIGANVLVDADEDGKLIIRAQSVEETHGEPEAPPVG
jgi:ATP-dependent Clp protease ATP-binding subunit ClpC